jgi:hypothetical protein
LEIKRKKTKKVLLFGGLGNKFFQIARAQDLTVKGFDVEVIYLEGRFLSLYKLTGHMVHDDWFDISMLVRDLGIKFRRVKASEFFSLVTIFLFRKLGVRTDFNSYLCDCIKSRYRFGYNNLDVGYFQSIKHVTPEATKVITANIINSLMISDKIIAGLTLHLRGGDFESSTRLQSSDISNVATLCREQFLHCFVVTNDIDYGRKTLQDIDLKPKFVAADAKSDFIFLASSSHLFVSNSTFSFWAAMCARIKQNAKIYGPKDWSYGDLLEIEIT